MMKVIIVTVMVGIILAAWFWIRRRWIEQDHAVRNYDSGE